MTTQGFTFVQDQLHAAANDSSTRVFAAAQAHPGAHWVDHHPAEATIAARLALALTEDSVVLCEHAQRTPSRLVWSPGMATLQCVADFAPPDSSAGEHAPCGSCGDAASSDLGLMFALGPITVVAHLCDSCKHAPPLEDDTLLKALTVVIGCLDRLWEPTP